MNKDELKKLQANAYVGNIDDAKEVFKYYLSINDTNNIKKWKSFLTDSGVLNEEIEDLENNYLNKEVRKDNDEKAYDEVLEKTLIKAYREYEKGNYSKDAIKLIEEAKTNAFAYLAMADLVNDFEKKANYHEDCLNNLIYGKSEELRLIRQEILYQTANLYSAASNITSDENKKKELEKKAFTYFSNVYEILDVKDTNAIKYINSLLGCYKNSFGCTNNKKKQKVLINKICQIDPFMGNVEAARSLCDDKDYSLDAFGYLQQIVEYDNLDNKADVTLFKTWANYMLAYNNVPLAKGGSIDLKAAALKLKEVAGNGKVKTLIKDEKALSDYYKLTGQEDLLKPKEEIKVEKVEEIKKEVKEKKKINFKLVFLSILVLIALFFGTYVGYRFITRNNVNLKDYIDFSVDGYSGYASANIDVNFDSLIDDLQEANSKLKLMSQEDITNNLLNGNINYGFSKSEDIKNGDKVTLSVEVNEDALKDYGLKLKGFNKTINVSGLEEGSGLDPFSEDFFNVSEDVNGVHLVYEGASPSLRISFNNNISSNDPRSDITYSISNYDENTYLKVGDTITIVASLQADGYFLTQNELSFTLDNSVPHIISDISELKDDFFLNYKADINDAANQIWTQGYTLIDDSHYVNELDITNWEWDKAYLITLKEGLDASEYETISYLVLARSFDYTYTYENAMTIKYNVVGSLDTYWAYSPYESNISDGYDILVIENPIIENGKLKSGEISSNNIKETYLGEDMMLANYYSNRQSEYTMSKIDISYLGGQFVNKENDSYMIYIY